MKSLGSGTRTSAIVDACVRACGSGGGHERRLLALADQLAE
jgi:hypothetical protein